MMSKDQAKLIFLQVQQEMDIAIQEHGNFNSLHEGHSVLREEFEELWDEIKKKKPDLKKVRAEAIQVAAMAIKLINHVDEVQ